MVSWQLGSLTFNPFDIVILVLWAIGMVSSGKAGLFQSFTKIAAFILSFPLSWILTPRVAPLLTFTTPFWAKYISFVGMSLLFFVLISFIGFVLSKFFSEIHLGLVDTVFGIIWGFLVSSVIIVFLFYILIYLSSLLVLLEEKVFSIDNNATKTLNSLINDNYLPQSLLFVGPEHSFRLTTALDLAFTITGDEKRREIIISPQVLVFTHRDFLLPLYSAFNLVEERLDKSSALFLINTVRTILLQYNEVASSSSPLSLSSFFKEASEIENIIEDFESKNTYDESEILKLVKNLRNGRGKKKSVLFDPLFYNYGKKAPSLVSADELRDAEVWLREGSKDKVLIVEDLEESSEASQNTVLKILEEPPEHGYIILLSKSTSKIKETLLSRLRRVEFSLPESSYFKYFNAEDISSFYFNYGISSEEKSKVESFLNRMFYLINSDEKMEKNEEEELLNTLDNSSLLSLFKNRIITKTQEEMKHGNMKISKVKKIFKALEGYSNRDLYNISSRLSFDIFLREVEIV